MPAWALRLGSGHQLFDGLTNTLNIIAMFFSTTAF
jgi:hypothetical protein